MYDCDTVNLRRKAEKIKKNDDSNLICGNFTFERSHKIVQRPSSFGNWGKEKQLAQKPCKQNKQAAGKNYVFIIIIFFMLPKMDDGLEAAAAHANICFVCFRIFRSFFSSSF